MSCQDFDINIDWQFNVNASDGDIRSESPLSSMGTLVAFSRFNPSTLDMDTIPQSIENIVLGGLSYGQKHNPPVVASYSSCRNDFPSIFEFFRRVPISAGGRRADFEAARRDISWQETNNLASVQNASNSWAAAENMAEHGTPRAVAFYEMAAMYHLLSGQRHNADVMQNYRACFRDNPVRIFYSAGFSPLLLRESRLFTEDERESLVADAEKRFFATAERLRSGGSTDSGNAEPKVS